MKKYYVGLRDGKRFVFSSEITPTKETYGSRYAAVIGAFRTKRGAAFSAMTGANNPHITNVADAERIAKAYAKNK